MVIMKDGLKFFATENKFSPERILINDDILEDVCNYIRTHKTQGIAFMGGYTQDNFNFIEEFSWLTTVQIMTTVKLKDLSVLNKLPKLISVWGEFRLTLNMQNNHLQYLAYDWAKKGIISEKCINLKHIFITGCKILPKFWDQVSLLPKLERIDFARGTMTDLTYMKMIPCLNRLDFNHLPQLVSLDGIGIVKETLKTLYLSTGENITNYMPLAELENLETLVISNNSIITDLSFLKSMKNLKLFRVIGTKITTSNLEFLEHIPQVLFHRTGLDNYKN